MNSPGSRSSWLITALTDSDTPGTTASTCALTSAVTCSRSSRRKGRTSILISEPPREGANTHRRAIIRRPLPVQHAVTLADIVAETDHQGDLRRGAIAKEKEKT